MPTPTDILCFWFPVALGDDPMNFLRLSGVWMGGARTDEAVRSRFGTLIEDALAGRLGPAWTDGIDATLAHILVLDQFTRHAFGGTQRQWAGDPLALPLALDLLDRGVLMGLPFERRVYLLMPLTHSEDPAIQTRNLALQREHIAGIPPSLAPLKEGLIERAELYHELIHRFGRFPFRNAVMGRRSTPEEQAFLDGFTLGPPRGMVPFVQQLAASQG